jgi:S1-C subfamily serine protease
VIVAEVVPCSTASRIGLRPGDVVLSVNGTDVKLVAELRRLVASSASAWRIRIRREDKVLNIVIRG